MILDKIYTNICDIFKSAAILPPIATSDHRAVLLQPQPDMKNFNRNRNRQVEQRRAGPNERTMFVHDLKQTDWTPLYRLENCDAQYRYFESTVTILMDIHMPKELKIKTDTDKPWITGYYKQLIARRQAAYKSNDIVTYQKLRNQSHRLSKRLRKDHYRQNVEQIKSSNPRQWWQSIKQFTNQTGPYILAYNPRKHAL